MDKSNVASRRLARCNVEAMFEDRGDLGEEGA